MRIDLPSTDEWSELANIYRAQLAGLAPALGDEHNVVQVFAGLRQAVIESTLGLAKLFSHKQTVAIVKECDPSFEEVAEVFSAEGYKVKILGLAELRDPSAWFPPLQNELLFVLFSQDDPVTGRKHDVQAVQTALKDKRAFQMSVSHSAFRESPRWDPALYEVQFLSVAPDRAVLIAGERFKSTPRVGEILPWNLQDAVARARTELTFPVVGEIEALKLRVLAFEAALPSGFKPYFSSGDDSRVFDRAVIYHPGLDGSAVITDLARSLGVELAPPGHNADLEAMSPCRWENPRLTEWLLARGDAPEVVRGMVVIDAKIVDDELRAKLGLVAEGLLKAQS